MANHHFGKFADVWKHLVLNEVLADGRPARYAETHAGSAAYPIVDDAERRYGVLGFLGGPTSAVLSATAYARTVSEFLDGAPPLYPGSALQAMTALGDETDYLLCDVDPASAEDLRHWSARLGLSRCVVAERDGLAAVREWLATPTPTVVHVDPFDPFAHDDGAPSAVELGAMVAEAGHALVYWYGYSSPLERAWALGEIGARTSASLWCADFMATCLDGSVRSDGDLGEATTAGTGSGVLLANVPPALLRRCEAVARELAASYEGRMLPGGGTGRLELALTMSP